MIGHGPTALWSLDKEKNIMKYIQLFNHYTTTITKIVCEKISVHKCMPIILYYVIN